MTKRSQVSCPKGNTYPDIGFSPHVIFKCKRDLKEIPPWMLDFSMYTLSIYMCKDSVFLAA